MIIPLSKAVLCANCSCVSDSNAQCEGCTSVALQNLANVLNRETQLPKDSEITALISLVDRTILAAVQEQGR